MIVGVGKQKIFYDGFMQDLARKEFVVRRVCRYDGKKTGVQ